MGGGEKRLIDANALYKKATAAWDDTLCDVCYSEIINLIDEAPTVDAVEVVRCKDCVYNKKGACDFSEFVDFNYRPDYFCGNGEREDV